MSNGIPLGWHIDPASKATPNPLYYDGEGHLVTVAPPRSGKGATMIVPALLEYRGSVFVIDPKGQNAAVTARQRRALGQKVYVLNPFKLHSGPPWNLPSDQFNPLAPLDPEGDDFVADIANLAEALIVNEGKDPHWANSARDLVSCFMMQVCLKAGETRTLPRVRELLTLPNEEYLNQILEMAADSFPPLRQKAGRFVSASSEMGNIRSTAITQTSFLDDPAIIAMMSGDGVRLADLKRHRVSVYVVLPFKYLYAYAKLLRIMTVSAVDAMTADSMRPSLRTLFILDEFANIGHLSCIETGFAMLGGFGVTLWPIVQSIDQLKGIYGDRWQTFLAGAGVVQYFTPHDMVTADVIKQRAGKTTVYVTNTSEGKPPPSGRVSLFKPKTLTYNESQSEAAVDLLSDEQIFSLPRDKQILFMAGLHSPILGTRAPYFQNPVYRGRYDPDPYHI
jgi:type IV secretion system protein VirD4